MERNCWKSLENVGICCIMLAEGCFMPNRINLLVVEDDEATCLEYDFVCKKYDDVVLVGTSAHSQEALNITEEFKPNAVVLDLELQRGSGSGLDCYA